MAGSGMGGSMGSHGAISGKKVYLVDILKHGRGPDRQKRKPRRSSVASVVSSKPSGKTWQGRDI